MQIFDITDKDLIKAGELLKEGKLVCFPTETIYGLGADASNQEAIKSIFTTKGRPNFNPLIAHVSSIKMAKEIAKFNKLAEDIAKEFWPGPLTFILKKKGDILCDAITAGLETIAVRMPANKSALKLIENSGVPIAAPSANKSGRPSPTEAKHITSEYKEDEIDGLVDGGRTEVGLESTIIDLTTETPTILRHGSITKNDLEKALSIKINESVTPDKKGKVKSPGQLLRHYSPSLPVRLNINKILENEALIAFGKTNLKAKKVINLSPNGDLKEAAHNLFAALIELDKPEDFSGIAVMPILNEGIGIAINDKLERASIK